MVEGKSASIQIGADEQLQQSDSSSFLKMKLPVDMQLSSTVLRELASNFKTNIKPWPTFAAKAAFNKPASAKAWYVRASKNVAHFQSNYILIKFILILYCLITSPFLLLVLAAAGGGCYIAKLRQAEKALVIGGHTVTLNQQYAGVGVLSIPFLFLAGAGSVLVWVMFASLVVIGSHASFYAIEQIVGDEEAPFDGVTVDEI